MAQAVTFLLIGLAIFRPDPNDPSNTEVGFGTKPGTTLYVKIQQADKFIISVNHDGSKLVSFSDGKGTDFSKQKEKGFEQGWLDRFPKIAEDGHSCIVKIRSGQLPKTDAREIVLKANIALTCGSGQKTARVEKVALKPETTFNVGSMTIKIDKVGEPDWGDAKLNVEFSTKQNLANIKSLDFFGADGQKIKTHGSSSSRMGSRIFRKSYNLDKKVDAVTLVVTYFDRVEPVVVSIDIRAGIGLGAPATKAELSGPSNIQKAQPNSLDPSRGQAEEAVSPLGKNH